MELDFAGQCLFLPVRLARKQSFSRYFTASALLGTPPATAVTPPTAGKYIWALTPTAQAERLSGCSYSGPYKTLELFTVW